jgi:hypothetical protein
MPPGEREKDDSKSQFSHMSRKGGNHHGREVVRLQVHHIWIYIHHIRAMDPDMTNLEHQIRSRPTMKTRVATRKGSTKNFPESSFSS